MSAGRLRVGLLGMPDNLATPRMLRGLADRGDVPSDAVAAVVNVAAVDPSAAGFFTVDDCTTANASSLNYTTNVNGANELVVKLNGDGELCVFTFAATHLLVDVVGYQSDGT